VLRYLLLLLHLLSTRLAAAVAILAHLLQQLVLLLV
jgi:hypothetical protein